MSLAQRLQNLRKEAHYSQEQLADLLDISRQAVSKWESGQGKPDLDNIARLTEIYNVSADYLISGQEHTPPAPAHPSGKLSHTAQKTIGIIAIIASTALITVLLIAALNIVDKYL